jgi:hypothetical protein
LYAFTAVADTFGGQAEFRLPQYEHHFASKFWQFIAYFIPNLCFHGCYIIQRLSEMGEWFAPVPHRLHCCPVYFLLSHKLAKQLIYFRHGV